MHEDGRLVKVYKTRRKRDLFLYVDFRDDLSRVPDDLLAQFGNPELALTVNLTSGRRLARADAAEVLSQIESAGYFLQLPPTDGAVDAEIERTNPHS